jgi:hypothetical protein
LRTLIDLQLSCLGRVGPQQHFELTGDGTLSILGQQLSKVKATVSDTGATVEATLDTRTWFIAGNPLNVDLHMDLEGKIDLRKRKNPEFDLRGDASLKVFGAEIKGGGGIVSRAGNISLFVEGALEWQSRGWLAGRIELGSGRVKIQGRTSVVLDLTPQNIGNLEFAHLFFKIDISGGFTFDTNRQLLGYDLSGDWFLASQFPSGQIFPLAMQEFFAQTSPRGGTGLKVLLIDVSGFNVLPLGNLSIPIPDLQLDETGRISLGVGSDSFLGVTYAVIKVQGNIFPPGTDPGKITSDYEIPTGFDLSSHGERTIQVPLSSLDVAFRLFLTWQDNQLGISIDAGGNPQFFPL